MAHERVSEVSFGCRKAAMEMWEFGQARMHGSSLRLLGRTS